MKHDQNDAIAARAEAGAPAGFENGAQYEPAAPTAAQNAKTFILLLLLGGGIMFLMWYLDNRVAAR